MNNYVLVIICAGLICISLFTLSQSYKHSMHFYQGTTCVYYYFASSEKKEIESELMESLCAEYIEYGEFRFEHQKSEWSFDDLLKGATTPEVI